MSKMQNSPSGCPSTIEYMSGVNLFLVTYSLEADTVTVMSPLIM